MRRATLALLASLPLPALAQPTVLPTRDVSVTYRMEGAARDAVPGGLPDRLTASWSAAQQALRIEGASRPQVLLLDLRTAKLDLIDLGLHSVVSFKLRQGDLDPIRLRGAQFTRIGSATVAGHACTDWRVTAPRSHGVLCLTDDGVPLRGSGTVEGRDGRFTAVSVRYEPVPPELLAPPAGFYRFPLPSLNR